MSTAQKNNLRMVMQLAWNFVKKNGYTLSEALKIAWLNIKLKTKLASGITEFYFKKVNGEIRQAFGTLQQNLLPQTKGSDKKPNDSLQIYFDTEVSQWRSYKKCNLFKII